MLFNPSDEKQKAGLLLFKDETHQYFLAVGKQGEKRVLSLEKIGESTETLASNDIRSDEAAIRLKVVSRGTHYDFYYAFDGDKEWTALCKDIDASFLSTATAGGFTGSVVGPYATCK